MKRFEIVLMVLLLPALAAAGQESGIYTLEEVISYGLEHSATVRSALADIGIEDADLRSARADRMPRVNLSGGVTAYKYPAPLTPIYGSPIAGFHFPEFDTTIYDASLFLTLPLYRGGRLDRAVTIAGLQKSMVQDLFRISSQELVYNLTSTYYKILQLQKFQSSNAESVKQLEAHRANVEAALRAGTAAKIDLLKTETELAHARQAELVARNSVESAYELLKTFMGVDEMSAQITLVEEPLEALVPPLLEDSLAAALMNRPDLQAAVVRHHILEERIALARGRRLPSVNIVSEYSEKAGTEMDFEKNWVIGLKLSLPIFDGGAISSDVRKSRLELEKAKEDLRHLRLAITREVRDAHLAIVNAGERIAVAETAIASAQESMRIEQIRFKAGAGTSTDVIDARTSLLRAETDYYQAVYDGAIARAALQKAIGMGRATEGDAR